MARLDRAEAKIRELTGQVEELAFRLRQTQDQLQAALGGAPLPNVAAAPQPNAAQAPAAQYRRHRRFGRAGQASGCRRAPGPADRPDGHGARRCRAGACAGRLDQVVSLGDPGADYERAYNASSPVTTTSPEASFRVFIATYPSDQRVSDAQYWLGESLFARGEYREAADEFLTGYKAYPQSGKAADTLLKLGLSLAGLGEREAACSTYAEVLKKYPKASNALRQRVATEQAVAGC